jgi:thiamine transport system substrate-binding protein
MLRIYIALLSIMLMLVACQPIGAPTAAPADADVQIPTPLVIASHNSFNASESLIAEFESTHNIQLQFLQLGDAGEALNKIILSADVPLADVFFGVDNTFLSRALNADIFIPYASPELANIPEEFQLDPEHRLLPVDTGYVNINADSEWFAAHDLPLPESLEDLIQPEYNGLLVVPNPATSSPGLAFLLTTIAHFGEEGYLNFWQALRANNVLVTDGWSEAYFTHFTVGSGGEGDRPLVVSYTTSPPADVIFAADDRSQPASVNVSPPGQTFQQIEFVGILQGTQQQQAAQQWVDFMLSRPFQEDMPLQMFVYPVNTQAELPPLFAEFAEVPTQPAFLPADEIEAKRETWIQAWTDVMLR